MNRLSFEVSKNTLSRLETPPLSPERPRRNDCASPAHNVRMTMLTASRSRRRPSEEALRIGVGSLLHRNLIEVGAADLTCPLIERAVDS